MKIQAYLKAAAINLKRLAAALFAILSAIRTARTATQSLLRILHARAGRHESRDREGYRVVACEPGRAVAERPASGDGSMRRLGSGPDDPSAAAILVSAASQNLTRRLVVVASVRI